MRKIDWMKDHRPDDAFTRKHRAREREIQRARESEFDAREDLLAEAIRNGALGPVGDFADQLTDQDRDWLRRIKVSWDQ